jgi:hypothetical protein
MMAQWLFAQSDPSAGGQVAGIALVALALGLVIVSALKGRWWAFFFLLVPILVFALPFTALRLAKPNSWWARRFYGDEKMATAIKRHGIVPADRVDQPVPSTAPSGVPARAPLSEASPPSGLPTQPPAGWYPDPHGAARLRYWDGADWTDQTGA